MKGLGVEIEKSLDTLIEGLNYDFFPSGEIKDLDAEKMRIIMNSKVSSFNSAKKILNKWMNSPNAPNKRKTVSFLKRMIEAGENAITVLRKALAEDINYEELDEHKFDAAIKAKPVILEAIFDLDTSIRELMEKLESGDLTLEEKVFSLGYPERFARGDFFPLSGYHKDWHEEEEDIVRLCPNSTIGEVIVIDDFKMRLPEVPQEKKILFYKLPKEEQYWRRVEPPKGISQENVDSWDKYIKEEFRRRREGIWFMNNGKPVYLTGNHYFALQHCKMLDNGGYMDFRYAQLQMFYHLEGCIIDQRSLGQHFTKSRRTGATYMILFVMLNHSTSTRNNNFGITSKSDTDASKAFLKYRYAFLNLPFYFRPVVYGKLDSTKQFNFSAPVSNSIEAKKNKKNNTDDYLNNSIDYSPTKTDAYDGQALYMYLSDESGKWVKPNDYLEHWGTVAPTMLEGGVVVGLAFCCSTVGAMSKGGSQFKELYNTSDITNRNPVTEMTTSGLYRYFLPAQDNMTAFTDKYGVCHKEKPTEKTYNVNGKVIKTGSIEYLISQENSKKAENDSALNTQLRAFPRIIEHAYRDASSECMFNMEKLYAQIEHNSSLPQEELYTVGNFEWKDVVDGDVEFRPVSNGRFKVAWMPSVADNTQHLQNRVKEINGKFFPLNTECVRFGCDPYSFAATEGVGSKGAIHGKTIFLPEGGAPSNKFVVEYIARPPDDTIFFEDVIKCVRFYGAPILVESNRLDLSRHMYNRGYRGFAMDRVDKPKHKLNDNEKKYGGQMMSSKDIISSHLNTVGTWIQNYVGECTDETGGNRKIGEMGDMPFNETLKDWLSFDPSNRTVHDAFISSGMSVMACQTEKYRGKVIEKKKFDISTLIPKYSMKGNMGTKIG